MIKGMYLAARSLDNRMKGIQVVANNLANLNTTGFKRELQFSEIMSSINGDKKVKGGNSKIRQVTDFTQGELSLTSNPLDLAISGKGFFLVKTDIGTEFTRNGRFKISDEGYLVTQSGDKVLGQNGEINLGDVIDDKQDSITISKNGEIRVGDKLVDKLFIAKVDNPQGSVKTTGENFASDDEEYLPAAEEDFSVEQGYLEESNINPIIEMEAMITMSKDYESSKKMITAFDQSLGQANEIGKV
jgi:fagellar hook-basal body proteins